VSSTLLETLTASRDLGLVLFTVILGWSSVYLLLPRARGGFKPARIYGIGALGFAAAVLVLSTSWVAPGPFLSKFFFYAFGLMAILGAALMVTSRDPVYTALWFASVILSSSGLFLLAGAQFLAAGTVIVYAGAIIVTFLFVIMLAQSYGKAVYDRMARRPLAGTLTSALLFAALLSTSLAGRAALNDEEESFTAPVVAAETLLSEDPEAGAADQRAAILERSISETSRLQPLSLPEPDSEAEAIAPVAGLGGSLFTDHLVSVEIVGLLLFTALIGAVAIATPKTPRRPGSITPGAATPGSRPPQS